MGTMVLAVAAAFASWPGGPTEPDRIGQIFIYGNARTEHAPILKKLHVYPGMLLPDEATLLRAEIRLLMRFHKRFDLDAGKRPTLKVLPREGDTPFRDVEVHFPESGYVIEPPDVLRIDVSGLPRKAPPVRGEHLVRPDGTVSLDTYGTIPVAGLTIDQARAAVANHLAARAKKRKDKLAIRVEVAAANSKAYFVLSAGQVYRFPCTGHETVADAVSQVPGGAGRAAKGAVWIARPALPGRALRVDWDGIVRGGGERTTTNYQLLPGDRLFIGGEPPK